MNFNLKSSEQSDALRNVERCAGYKFKDKALLKQSLIHPSYASETSNLMHHNQRMEFLGDSVLQIILSTYLYNNVPDAQEGTLTRMRSYMANEAATASYSLRLGLDRVLLLGNGECQSGGRQRPSILGDLFEAFLGAVYLDGGMEAAHKVALSLMPPLAFVRERLAVDGNPKGALQELCQEQRMGNPSYELLDKSGPSHSPVFTLRVVVGGRELARATGSSHKLAEREAAETAYYALRGEKGRLRMLALDFDGVICDSAAETAGSGWKAARKIWPKLFADELPDADAVAAFRKVRPYLETGYQAILLTKLVQEGVSPDAIGADAEGQFERIMREKSLTREGLIALFGETRDTWIRKNEAEWLAWHGFFPGVLDALNAALKSGWRVMILTTKQERFVAAALENAGVHFPTDEIYGLDRHCKKEAMLLSLLKQNPAELHFVEDRLNTLLRIESESRLESVILHYADWGYGTKADTEAADDDPHINVLSLEQFNAWLSSLTRQESQNV